MRRPCGGRHRFTTAPTKQVLTDARCPQRVPPIRGGAHPRCGLCRARSRRRHDRQLRTHWPEGRVLDHTGRPGPAHRRGEPARTGLLERRHARDDQGRLRILHGRQHRQPARAGQGGRGQRRLGRAGRRPDQELRSRAVAGDDHRRAQEGGRFLGPLLLLRHRRAGEEGHRGRRDLDQGPAHRRAAGDHRRHLRRRDSSSRRRRPRCSPTRPRCSRRCSPTRSTSP